jgi:hypothetical protein
VKINRVLCCCLMIVMAAAACGGDDPGREWAGKLTEPETRRAAIDALDQGGAETVPALIALVGHRDRMVYGSACMIIDSYSPDPSFDTAIPLFYQALDSPKMRVRLWSAWALVKLGENGDPIVDAVRSGLAAEELEFRSNALTTLEQLGPENAPLMVGCLVDPELDIRYRAARMLGASGNGSDDVVRGLVEATGDEHPRARVAAFHALAELTTVSDLAGEELQRLAGETSADGQPTGRAIEALVELETMAAPEAESNP